MFIDNYKMINAEDTSSTKITSEDSKMELKPERSRDLFDDFVACA
jgi:hypothetical protein